jgi:hypothetical protein
VLALKEGTQEKGPAGTERRGVFSAEAEGVENSGEGGRDTAPGTLLALALKPELGARLVMSRLSERPQHPPPQCDPTVVDI